MKSIIAFIIAGLVATVSAQTLTDLPPCAVTCLMAGLAAAGCGNDIKCACTNQSYIISSGACIQSSCSASDQQKAQTVAAAICGNAGATVSSSSVAATTTYPASSNSTTKSYPSVTASSSTRTLNTTATPTGSGNITHTTSTPTQTTNAGNRLGSIGGLTLLGLGLAGYLTL